ncbi:MAG TPA: hypothetical protein VFF69_13980 [Phycisphaerales bacterium]|nr:hypothetical protein [Phycisphaerales bacterium]
MDAPCVIDIAAFEARAIPLGAWNHRAHLTIAYLYLREHGLAGAIERMRRGIQAFNAAAGVADTPTSGYHETLTVAWLRVIDTMMRIHGPGAGPDEFLESQPYLLNRLLLRLFYSRPRIMSEEAKKAFVEPDLAPLPAAPR